MRDGRIKKAGLVETLLLGSKLQVLRALVLLLLVQVDGGAVVDHLRRKQNVHQSLAIVHGFVHPDVSQTVQLELNVGHEIRRIFEAHHEPEMP